MAPAVGQNRAPKSMLRAVSGRSAALPIVFWMISICWPFGLAAVGRGSVKFGTVVVTGAANSSERLGARTSRDVTARRRKPLIGVCKVSPVFRA
jgi:hypothetical protein